MTDTDARLIERQLREAVIQCGRAAGALLADDVSNEFLKLVPGEVKARIESLTAEVAARDAIIAEVRLKAQIAANAGGKSAPWFQRLADEIDEARAALGDSK